MSAIEIRAAGHWLSMIGEVADVEWSDRADGGCNAASWQMDLPENFSDPALSAGARVDLYDGATIIWTGRLAEPDRDTWTFHANGLAKAAETTTAHAGADLSTNPHEVVTAAIARGMLPWTYRGQLPNAAHVAANGTERFHYVKGLLDAVAEASGKRWGVGPEGEFYYEDDPTTPAWAINPDSGTMGVADDDYYSHIYGRYASEWSTPLDNSAPTPISWALAGASDLASANRWTPREKFIDFTESGFDGAETLTAIESMLAQSGARMGYTNGLELTALNITTIGGTISHLPLVRARQMYRLHGVLDDIGAATLGVSHDFVAGEVRHRPADRVVEIFPVGLVDRDLESILSAPEPRETA